MKKAILVASILLAVAFSPPSASALTLTNTALTDAEFQGFAGAPLLLSSTGAATFIGGSQGVIDSAAFAGRGAAAGLFVYTYRLTVSAGEISAMSVAGFGGNIVTNLELGGGAGADSSFNITGALTAGGDLAGFYGGNGPLAPEVSILNDTTGAFQSFWIDPVITAASGPTRIFGVVSSLAPRLVVADALDGGPTTSSPLVVAPAPPVPEPGTLLLLGSGLSGLAAWGWRRRRG